MTEKEAFEVVVEVIRPFVRHQENFKRVDSNSRIWEDLQVNSSRFIDILLLIETTFDMEIDIDAFDGVSTVGDVARLLIEMTEKNPVAVGAALEKIRHASPTKLAP